MVNTSENFNASNFTKTINKAALSRCMSTDRYTNHMTIERILMIEK